MEEFSNPEAELFKLQKPSLYHPFKTREQEWIHGSISISVSKTHCFKSKKNESESDF